MFKDARARRRGRRAGWGGDRVKGRRGGGGGWGGGGQGQEQEEGVAYTQRLHKHCKTQLQQLLQERFTPDATRHASAGGREAKDSWQIIRPYAKAHEGSQGAQKVLLVPLDATKARPRRKVPGCLLPLWSCRPADWTVVVEHLQALAPGFALQHHCLWACLD